jgi:hypothetical protein
LRSEFFSPCILQINTKLPPPALAGRRSQHAHHRCTTDACNCDSFGGSGDTQLQLYPSC